MESEVRVQINLKLFASPVFMDYTEKSEMATFKFLSSFIIISGLFFLYILNNFCIWMIFYVILILCFTQYRYYLPTEYWYNRFSY